MRKWGLVVSAGYALIVLCLVVPGAIALASGQLPGLGLIVDVYQEWAAWIPMVILLAGQALLLFLSVDTSWRHNRPRAHIVVSCAVTGALLALLVWAAVSSLLAGTYGDHIDNTAFGPLVNRAGIAVSMWAILWLIWGYVFSLYARDSSNILQRAVAWLLAGSVLELLVAVPCHVIVRRRHDCSAPIGTSFGIGTGIAIMLLAFGPSVLWLYKKRLNSYSKLTK